jgi:hypothetical protein
MAVPRKRATIARVLACLALAREGLWWPNVIVLSVEIYIWSRARRTCNSWQEGRRGGGRGKGVGREGCDSRKAIVGDENGGAMRHNVGRGCWSVGRVCVLDRKGCGCEKAARGCHFRFRFWKRAKIPDCSQELYTRILVSRFIIE